MKTLKQKQEESKIRDEVARNRTPEEQLRRLDEKFGEGVGAKRERTRLESIIEYEKIKKEAEQQEKENLKTRKRERRMRKKSK